MHSIAYRQRVPGKPLSLERVNEELPPPERGEVLMRIHATALNARDLAMLNGRLPMPVSRDVIPLSDAAGEVVALGEGVTRFAVGDKVVNAFYGEWIKGRPAVRPIQYATVVDGWLCTYRVISAEALSAMPAHLSFKEAATLPCAGVTAWSALLGVAAGDTVLTQGSGGVSLFAIQLAKAAGARVIATTTRGHKRDQLAALGADHVIDTSLNPEWALVVKELTGGFGVERIVEVGGPGTLDQSIQAVRYKGQVSIVGALGARANAPQISFSRLFQSQARYECIGVGSRTDLEQLIEMMSRHRIHPVIDSTFSFEQCQRALHRLSGRDLFGKIVLVH